MTLPEFNTLPLTQKFNTLCSWGFLMVRKRIGRCTVSLVSVDDFFVEVTFDKTESRLLNVNSYAVENLPLHYYQVIDGENPFVASASVNSQNFRETLLGASWLTEKI
jgi:hypothetical protein